MMKSNIPIDPKREISFLFFFLVLLSSGKIKSQDLADSMQLVTSGKKIFGTHCSSCHSIHYENIGPALASITKKRSYEWIVSFIKNSQSVIAGNDTYANLIYSKYNHVMPSFDELKVTELKELLYFIDHESKVPTSYSDLDLSILQNSNPDILYGRQLFNQQCSSCHSIYYEKYGPALGSVTKRLDINWLIPFVRNSQKVILNGDPYATRIFKSYDNKIMVTMDFLTKEQVRGIFAYVEYASSMNSTILPNDSINTKKRISPTNSRQDTSLPNQQESLIFFKILIFMVLLTSTAAIAFVLISINLYLRKEHHD